jgi:HAD superfamily hydrolase (TIGR01509 family)
MIKSVIFDVDGVLVDSFEANFKFHQDLLIKTGYKPPTRKEYSKVFHMTMIEAIRSLTGSKDENEIIRIWQMGKDRIVPYHNELLTSPKNFEAVIEELKQKYILGIVTSRIHGGVFSLPPLKKFENDFKTVVYYDDTTKHKPDPEPLLLAAKRLGIKPSETVYIGDMESDIKAAKSAGMRIIIYSKENPPGADAITSSFYKLPDLIGSLK